ncbi:MAG: glycosyltransferase [Bacteroidetes bacterium]|nr:glycosyltransferase [Bacteroidota bacterium]
MKPALTLIIAVYNNVPALRFIFAALARQSFPAFEVIVADDGSARAMAETVNDAKRLYRFPIRHLWHADKGWRKNVMLNYAISEAATDYLVFIDGDCIPGEHFLQDHFEQREQGKVLLGRRVEHGKRWAKALTMDAIHSGAFERYSVSDLLDGLTGSSVRLEHGFRITSPLLRSYVEKNTGMLGSNFSTFRQHLVDVNGFDESYDGPGFGEDTDIFYRLNLNGVTGKSLRNLAVQYHLWHPQTRVPDRNRNRFEEVQRRNSPLCRNGLRKLP